MRTFPDQSHSCGSRRSGAGLNLPAHEAPGVDVLTSAQRSLCMSRIRGRDTKPEMLIRRELFARGFRYRLHSRTLPGRPDLVFPARRAVIFVHGCFWHAHDCARFSLPATRREFWERKLQANRERDASAISALQREGWRVLVIWECALTGRRRRNVDAVLAECASWLADPRAATAEIQGSDQADDAAPGSPFRSKPLAEGAEPLRQSAPTNRAD